MKPPTKVVCVVPDEPRFPKPDVRVYKAGNQGSYILTLKQEGKAFKVYETEVEWKEKV